MSIHYVSSHFLSSQFRSTHFIGPIFKDEDKGAAPGTPRRRILTARSTNAELQLKRRKEQYELLIRGNVQSPDEEETLRLGLERQLDELIETQRDAEERKKARRLKLMAMAAYTELMHDD